MMGISLFLPHPDLAVVPVLIGPLSALMALLPAILAALGGILITLFKPATIKRLFHFLWVQKFPVFVFVVLIWGAVHFLPALFHSSVSESAEGSDWPLWRGGARRIGAVRGGDEPSRGNVNWSYVERDVKTFFSSPAVVGNRVYITSALYEYFKNTGAICSVDADTGDEVWSYSSEKYLATFSSPAVSGNHLVVGEGLHLTKGARIICMDIAASEKKRAGVKRWEYRTTSHVESSPCIYEDRVFIGAGDDGFYCLALEPKTDGTANVLWHLDGEEYPDCETSPVARDGNVYFGLGINGNAICCVDTEAGDLLWKVEAPYPVFGSPSMSADGSRLFVGMGHGDFINTAEQVASNLRMKLQKEGRPDVEIEAAVAEIKPIGEVWCLDAKTGEKKWTLTLDRTVLGAIAVDGDRLYVNSRDGHIYCLSLDGKLLKKWNAHEPLITSPSVGEEHLYVVTASARLYGLDKKTLSPVWEVSLDASTLSSPVLARGHIYVGTANKGLLCVGESASEPKEAPFWAGHLGGNGRSGSWDGSLLPGRGSYARWNIPTLGSTAAACLDGFLYAGVNRTNVSGLAQFRLGEPVSDKPEEMWLAPSKNPVSISPAAVKGSVFFVDGRSGDSGRKLRCLDPESGAERWSRPVEPEAEGRFIIRPDRLFVSETAQGITCCDVASGTVRWQVDTGKMIGPPALAGGLLLIASADPAHLAAFDAETGLQVWEKVSPAIPTTGPLFMGDRVWVGLSFGVAGLSLVQGVEDVQVDCGAVTGPLVADGLRLAALTEAGKLHFIDSKAGVETACVEGVTEGFPPLLTENACLYSAENAIKLYDFYSGASRSWTRLTPSYPGRMITPMVMVESTVFFATDKKGLLCMKPKK